MTTKEVLIKYPDTSYSNIHKVSKKQWSRWSNKARYAFNYLYGTVSTNKSIFCALDKFPIDKKNQENLDAILEATIWNMAWGAADQVDAIHDTSE